MAKAKTDNKLDLVGLEAAKVTASNLISTYSILRQNQADCENAYYMTPTETPAGNDLKLTFSPDPHNKVRGGIRLLSATSPTFNVPSEKNNEDTKQKSSLIESGANAMWAASNAVQGIVVESDEAYEGLLHGEMHLRVISTKDMLVAAQAAKTENKDPERVGILDADIAHAQEINSRVPYLFEPLDATTCYVVRGRRGLEAHYQRVETTVGDVLAAYGGNAERALAGQKSYIRVWLNIFVDRLNTYVWAEGASEPILAGPHGLTFIPVAYYAPEGSSTASKPERKVLPFLYPVLKSGVWNRQNLFLTQGATAAALLMNATWIHTKGPGESDVHIDTSVMGGVIEVEQGGSLMPLAKDIINQQLVQQMQMYDNLMDQSTIFDQTLGQPLGSNATFSETALMHQAGRLPLNPIQKGMATLFADAMSIAFRWLKKDGKATVTSNKDGSSVEIDPAEIPASLNFEVTVDVNLPQDKMQQAQVADQLTQGPDPLVSKEWARTNTLNIGQSENEQAKIWKEQLANLAAQQVFPQFIQQLIQALGMAQTQPGGGPNPAETQGQPPQPGQPGQPGQPIEPIQPIPSGQNPGQ